VVQPQPQQPSSTNALDFEVSFRAIPRHQVRIAVQIAPNSASFLGTCATQWAPHRCTSVRWRTHLLYLNDRTHLRCAAVPAQEPCETGKANDRLLPYVRWRTEVMAPAINNADFALSLVQAR
jgi:hypothetical protein